MKEKMINFVVDKKNGNKIVKITKQFKRALNMMTKEEICVISYNPKIYPLSLELKVGDVLDENKIEMKKVCL